MKLSFSVQYWKDLSWSDCLAAAIDAKLGGVELYDISGAMFAGKDSPTNPELAAATRRSLTNRGLSLPCVDTVGDFTDPDFARELAECLEVAVNLGVPGIGIHTSSDTGASPTTGSSCSSRSAQAAWLSRSVWMATQGTPRFTATSTHSASSAAKP